MIQFYSRFDKKYIAIFLICCALLFLSACSIEIDLGGLDISDPVDYSGLLQVTFIDTGQSDCIFIKTPGGKAMLIDAGNNDDGNTITRYIKQQGINKLDVVVGTHPHEDHIGALDDVINAFDIGKIYMPRVTHTSKTYLDVLEAVKGKNMKITSAKGGMNISLAEDVTVEILAPNGSNYEGFNNYSVVVKLTYRDTSFLFTGDAEKLSEQEMLKKQYDLSADVLKIGHHGSNTSTTKEFLSAVSPKYGVICVEKGNPYGHPHKEVLKRLSDAKVQVYTTMEKGNIVMTSDGQIIEVRD